MSDFANEIVNSAQYNIKQGNKARPFDSPEELSGKNAPVKETFGSPRVESKQKPQSIETSDPDDDSQELNTSARKREDNE